ncbi:phage tail protein [Sphingopyxis sp. QXT-31]|uniref:phage tail protein n=1 Tax=Sphingopyxis sp. QXT-31 TaxID=1357916 RepID=UPI001E48B1C6|nr:tail fiber protein [Sphingopyxis sp. QXT-31]
MAIARKSHFYMSAAAVLVGVLALPGTAQAQFTYLGEVMKFGGNFCPRGSAEANGQLLSIAQNTALFSLYGTTYGGDGQTTFALPNMAGRYSMHLGQGPGLTNRTQGEAGGTETTTLTENQMPRHEHTGLVRTTSAAGNNGGAFRNIFPTTPANKYVNGTAPNAQLMNRETVIIRNTGNNTPYNHLPPYLAIRFCVLTEGIFPSRN